MQTIAEKESKAVEKMQEAPVNFSALERVQEKILKTVPR